MIVDVILFCVVAFIVYQLYSTLGRTPTTQKPTRNTARSYSEPPLATPQAQIKQHIANFDEAAFIQGATNAFTHIVAAFIAGDLEGLKPWLEPKLFRQYKQEIAERNQAKLTYDLAFFRHIHTNLVRANIQGARALITVRFSSEQSLVLRKNKKIIEGCPETTEFLEDTWVFSHTLSSKDSVWFLHKTLENGV